MTDPMLETIVTRAQIVAEARTWLGTRWLHQGRLKGVGVDCVGLAYGVGVSLPIFGVEVESLPPYERRTTDNQMIQLCVKYLVRVAKPRLGSVVAMRFDATTRHMGILGDYPGGGFSLIHAYAVSRKVVEHRLDELWRARIVASFDFPGVSEA
jgi:NlpC/P60 family putative phage cell wall peptidase